MVWLEYIKVGIDMALIRCAECKKEVSSNAVSCPHCGSPIGGSGSIGSVAFEKRIEQYKAKGFSLRKRDGNTVKMRGKKIMDSKKRLILMIAGIVWIIVGTLFMFALGLIGYVFGGLFIAGGVAMMVLLGKDVSISLTTTGKIEEVGNVLKNK